jgi:hypothetical protein
MLLMASPNHKEPAVPIATAVSSADNALDRPLALGWRLVGAAETFAIQFAQSNLGAIDLPPVVGTAADRTHIQTIAPLYLAAELEAARLVPAVETLAGVFASGGLTVDLGPATQLLTKFWQGRHQRFAAAERQAFFARLFGAGPGPTLAVAGSPTEPGGTNTTFESLMIDLAEVLYQFNPSPFPNLYVDEAPLRVVARQLAANLLPRSGGIATFAARDLLGILRDALAILKQPLVQRAVRAHGVWEAVRAITSQFSHQDVGITQHVERGKSGMLILTWLAEVLPQLDNPGQRVFLSGHTAVRAAAGSWLQASLALHEFQSGATPQRA